MDEVDSAQPSTSGHIASRQGARNGDLSPPDLAANADDTWNFTAAVHESPADPVSTITVKEADEASGDTSSRVNETKKEGDRIPSTTTTNDGKSDLPMIDQKQDETSISGDDIKNRKQSMIHPSDNTSTADATKHEPLPSPNPVQSITNIDNQSTVAGVAKQDGDGQRDIADTWFRAVISGEAESVQTVLPLITNVNLRDQVMIYAVLWLYFNCQFCLAHFT